MRPDQPCRAPGAQQELGGGFSCFSRSNRTWASNKREARPASSRARRGPARRVQSRAYRGGCQAGERERLILRQIQIRGDVGGSCECPAGHWRNKPNGRQVPRRRWVGHQVDRRGPSGQVTRLIQRRSRTRRARRPVLVGVEHPANSRHTTRASARGRRRGRTTTPKIQVGPRPGAAVGRAKPSAPTK